MAPASTPSAPGPIETDLTGGLQQTRPAAHRFFSEATALKRYGRPDDVTAVMQFLLSTAASYITGTAVAVDGGAMADNNLELDLP